MDSACSDTPCMNSYECVNWIIYHLLCKLTSFQPQIWFHDAAFLFIISLSNYPIARVFFGYCYLLFKKKTLSFAMNENFVLVSRCWWTVFSLNVTNTNLNHDMRLVNDITWIKSPAVCWMFIVLMMEMALLVYFSMRVWHCWFDVLCCWWGKCWIKKNKRWSKIRRFSLWRIQVRFYWYLTCGLENERERGREKELIELGGNAVRSLF